MGGAYANYFPFHMCDVIRLHHVTTTTQLGAAIKYCANNAAGLCKFVHIFASFCKTFYFSIYFILFYMCTQL